MQDRIKAIAEAVADLFLQQGYSKTQISHIAKAVGVSVGTIYLDFAGKKEIMHFVLKSTIDPAFADQDFQRPITDDLFGGKSGDDFAKHLAQAASAYSLEDLVSDAFDLLARYAVGCLFIEKNQFDFPYLAAAYKKSRQRFHQTMTAYLNAFVAAGTVRPLALTTTLIVELLSWWAMDVRYTSFEKPAVPLPLAKAVCMDNIIAAYQCPSGRFVPPAPRP